MLSPPRTWQKRVSLSPPADYQSLRIGGLVFAVVLFTVGILLILSEPGSGAPGRAGAAVGKNHGPVPPGRADGVSLLSQAGGAGAVSATSPGE